MKQKPQKPRLDPYDRIERAGALGFLGSGCVCALSAFLLASERFPERLGTIVFLGSLAAMVVSIVLMNAEKVRILLRDLRLPRLARQMSLPPKSRSAYHQLLKMGRRAVPIFLKVLSSKGGQTYSETLQELWDGDIARRRAAEGLGRLKAAEAMEPLLQVLDDPDIKLRLKALWALGEIGDLRAAPALALLLTRGEEEEVRIVRNRAAEILGGLLGERSSVEAFCQTLQGDPEALEQLKEHPRREVVEGFIHALNGPHVPMAVHAAWALGEWGAVESLPTLRSKAGVLSLAGEQVKEACAQAIAKLEARAGLPRPAEAPEPEIETLPRPALALEPNEETLPRLTGEPEPTEEVLLRRTGE